MSGMMEVPASPPRGKGPAMAKGLLALLGVSVLVVPWGTSEAQPSSIIFDSPAIKAADGESPAAPPPAPPNAPLISVGRPLDMCPPWAPGLGFMGAASGLVFSNIGAAYGTGKAAQGISRIGVKRPELVFKNIVPIVMAGVLSIYGMIIGVIIASGVTAISGKTLYSDYSLFTGCAHLFAGLTCGLTSLSCGIALGIAGDAGVRSVAAAAKGPASEKLYIGMVLIQGTGSALGMYGLIVGLIMTTVTSNDCGVP